MEVALPALITVSNEINKPRYPTLRGIMAAGKKQIPTWDAAALGIDPAHTGAQAAHARVLKLYVPVHEAHCEFLDGDTDEERREARPATARGKAHLAMGEGYDCEWSTRGVVAEVSDGKLAGIAQELLGAGRRLADALGEELAAAVLGSQVGDSGTEAIAYGADKAYVIDDPLLASPQPDAYAAALEHLCRDVQPSILLLGKTSLGIEVGRDWRSGCRRRSVRTALICASMPTASA